MSTYENLHGRRVNVVSSNPSNPKDGEVWYNSTLGLLKGYVLGTAVWTSGGALNTKRSAAIAGTVTAGLASHGYVYSPSSPVGGSVATEEYNGTSWTSVNNANQARYQTSALGTQTAAVVFGGLNGTTEPGPYTMSASFESYNGTTWTALTNAPTAKAGGTPMVGTSTTLAQVCGNSDGSGGVSNTVQEYASGSWSAGENYPISIQGLAGAGIQTASVHMGGATAAPGSPVVDTANEYDGTNFSASPASLTLSRYGGGPTSSGSNSAYMVAGGYTGTAITNTSEVFNKTAMTVTAAAWSSGGALPSGAQELFGSGIQTAALCGGGEGVTANPPNAAEDNVFEYDGSSWTAGGSIPVRSNKCSGCGTQTATIIGGKGTDPYSGASGATRSYDGSSWTAEPSLGTARYNTGLAGTTTAAVAAYGRFPPSPFTNSVTTEEWDGSSWTAGNNANNSSTISESAGGSQTAAIYASLNPGAKSETYDGTNWTNISPTVGNNGMTGSGTQTDFIIADGNGAFRYNGTVWATSPDISTARGSAANSNVAATGLISGGVDKSTATEEFTDESTSLNLKTITDS